MNDMDMEKHGTDDRERLLNQQQLQDIKGQLKEKTSERLKLSKLKEAKAELAKLSRLKEAKVKHAETSLSEKKIKERIVSAAFYEVGHKTSICLLTLKNGFEVVGTSSCVDPRNFDAEIGRGLAYEDAVDKLWALEGYLLQEALQQVIPDYEG